MDFSATFKEAVAQLRTRYGKERSRPLVACSECHYESFKGFVELHDANCSRIPTYARRKKRYDAWPLTEPCHTTRFCAFAHHCYRCRPGHVWDECEECSPLFPV